MEEIIIIRDKTKLEGTCYIELAPGKYQGNHWVDGSLFFDEEIFGLIEPIFKRCIDSYDHYNMNDGTKFEWKEIIKELEELNRKLESAKSFREILGLIGFKFCGTRDYFETKDNTYKKELIYMNNEIIEWANRTLKSYENIAVLGI